MEQLIEYTRHHWEAVAIMLAAAAAVLVYELRLRGSTAGGVSAQDAVRLLNQGATVLDVRSADEFATGHIRGAKRVDDLDNASASFARLRDRAVIVCCAQGTRSASAVRKLAAQGFTKAYNLRGGLRAWSEANLPLSRE